MGAHDVMSDRCGSPGGRSTVQRWLSATGGVQVSTLGSMHRLGGNACALLWIEPFTFLWSRSPDHFIHSAFLFLFTHNLYIYLHGGPLPSPLCSALQYGLH